MARLATIKTLSGFDFSFQPSLDRNRIHALAQLDFIDHHEVVHFIGQSGTGKSHVSIALPDSGREERALEALPLARRSERGSGPAPATLVPDRRYPRVGQRCRGRHPATRVPERLDDVTTCPGPGLAGENKEIVAA